MTRRLVKSTTALLLVSLCLAGCGTPEQKEARYIKRGDKLFAHGDYTKARLEYLNAARLKPTDANALYHLGIVDDAEGNFHDAYVNFKNAEQQDAHFHPALLKLAEYYLAASQYAPANQRIDSVLAESPNDPQARALLASRFLRQKQYAECDNEAQRSLTADPNNILAAAVLTESYKAQNKIDEAKTTIQNGIDHNPRNETLIRAQAELYDSQGDLTKAAEIYQRLFTIAPNKTKYRLQLASDYLKAGQIDQAETVLREGTIALPDDWEMKHQLVLFLANRRGVQAAEGQLKQYIKDNPQKSEPIDWLINLYVSHKMIGQADAFLDHIIDQDNYDKLWIDAMVAKARLDYLRQKNDTASKNIAVVLKKDPNNLDAQFIKAHIEADEGFDQQAIIDLRSIIRDKPDAKEAYVLLSDILSRENHKDLAIETLNQMADLGPLSVDQQVKLAQLNASNGDISHAMGILISATKTDPTYPVSWETMARLALETKNWAAADSSIETLDALPGQHITAFLLRGEKLALTNKPAAAEDIFKQIINADATTPQAQYALESLVRLYQLQGQLSEAILYLQSIKPDTPLVNTFLGQCYLASGNSEKAGTSFDKAIAEHAKTQDPYIERARLLIRQHKNDQALVFLNEASAIDRSDIRATLAKAQLLEQMEQYPQAIDTYTELLTKYPDNVVAANNLAELIADRASNDTKLMEQARQIAERFTASQNPLLLDTLGWVYFKDGHLQDATGIFERAAALAPQLPPQFHYHYGMALLSDNQRDQARIQLTLAVAKDAEYPGSDEAAKTLASLPIGQ